MNSQNNWYKTFFNGLALDFWAKAMTPEYTNAEIKFIKEMVSLAEGDTIIDVPCGFGRHTIALAKEGFNVTGIDIAEDYIHTLNEAISEFKLQVTTIHADILEYELRGDYDVALCLGNSFSYFTYADTLAFAKKISGALKNGGACVINTGAVAESILPAIITKDWVELDDMVIMMERKYHAESSVLQSDYRITSKGETEYKTAWHYVYTLAEIRRILFEAGFTQVEQYGGFDKSLYKLGDKQAYFLARK
jgi:SAM-dependent methyltransferase